MPKDDGARTQNGHIRNDTLRLGRLRCLAYGGSPVAHAGRGWFRAIALERAAFERLAGGGEIDLLFCHDPRTLEQGTQGSSGRSAEMDETQRRLFDALQRGELAQPLRA